MRRRFTLLHAFVTLLAMFGASGAITPLFRIYQQEWRLSPLYVTVIFGIYAVGFLGSVLTVGALSDHVGRRPVIMVALLLEILAMAALMTAGGPHSLLTARLLQGVATGAAGSTCGAVILDTTKQHGALINAISPLAGTGAGALVSSIVVMYAPAPTQLVFQLLLALFCILTLCAAVCIETAARRAGALASLLPRINVPPSARAAFLSVAPVNVAVWALAGFHLSLMPSLLQLVTGSNSALIGGGVPALLASSGAVGVLALHRLRAAMIFRLGAASLLIGVAVTLAGVAMRSLPMMMAGTFVAGMGFGSGFYGGLRTVLPLAAPNERAGLLSAVLSQCYIAFSVPAVLASLCIAHVGLVNAAYGYGAAIIILACVSLLLSTRTLAMPDAI